MSNGKNRFLAPFIVALALGASSTYAADSHVVVARSVHAKKVVTTAPTLPRPVDAGLDGVLVAPNCPGGCNKQNQPGSVIDWLRAQVARLVA